MIWIKVYTNIHGTLYSKDGDKPFCYIEIDKDKFAIPLIYEDMPPQKDIALMEEMTTSDIGLILINKTNKRYGLCIPGC